MRFWRTLAVLGLGLAAHSAAAKTVRVEYLIAKVSPETVGPLSGLFCRNVDRMVHLRIMVTWPESAMSVEEDGFKRLILQTGTAEFLFPAGSFDDQHGAYSIEGYFIARSGGMHQGIASDSFEKVADAKVPHYPDMVEIRTASPSCRR